ncbi:MAG: hypothetical protein VYA54_08895 [Bdellovibrionota bacterium]|nr:hypothetical protein [Bdellovibrionota bacterium]
MIYGFILLAVLGGVALTLFPVRLSEIKITRSKKLSPAQEIANQLLKNNYNLDLPVYKFYDTLIFDLISFQKRFGANLTSAFVEIRKALNLDMKIDLRIKNLKQSSYFQYLTMCGFTWLMLTHMSSSLGITLDSLDLMLVFVWQGIGLLAFRCILKVLTKRICDPFLPLFELVYSVRCQFKVSRPIQEIKENMEKFIQCHRGKSLQDMIHRLEFLLEILRTQGKFSLEELDCLCEESWNSYEIALEQLEKAMVGVKLGSFLFFIVPCYFYSLTLALGQSHI